MRDAEIAQREIARGRLHQPQQIVRETVAGILSVERERSTRRRGRMVRRGAAVRVLRAHHDCVPAENYVERGELAKEFPLERRWHLRRIGESAVRRDADRWQPYGVFHQRGREALQAGLLV